MFFLARRLDTGQAPPLAEYQAPCLQTRPLPVPQAYVQVFPSVVQAVPRSGIPSGQVASAFGASQCQVGDPVQSATGPVEQLVHEHVKSP